MKSSPSAEHTGIAPVADNYEAALQQLQRLVKELETGQLPLDTLLAHYTQGVALLEFCKTRLQALEDQVQILDQRLDQGDAGEAA